MSSDLVKSFNALPRKERAPSGRVPNEWHFDLRYIQLEPTPSHIIALIQSQSLFIHIERLPVGLPANQSGIEYFPESGKEAAPEVAKALLRAFVGKLGQSSIPNAPAAFSPWKLTTEDKDLASAVTDELKRIGVRPLELCNIGLSKPQTNFMMQEAFTRLFATLKTAAGYTGIAAASIKTPQPFIFWNFKLDPLEDLRTPAELGDPDELEKVEKFQLPLKYLQTLTNARPPDPNELDTKSVMARFGPEMQVLLKMLEERPEGVVKTDADAGDADAALDYGVRLSLGLGCTRDRTKSRVYLIKAILSPTASDKTKATAHGALLNWYVSSSKSDFRSRYLFAACHHANIAARLCCKINNPLKTPASPAVLWFMKHIFERMAKGAPEMYLFYKDAQDVYEARNRQIEGQREKMQLKRLKNPMRYRCAAVGCGVEADSGKMLSRCSGKCDSDKKPSYCSKECQKADWKNHKPFCSPGAECSVIDDGTGDAPGPPRPSHGALQLPITHAGNGSRTFVGSSTMDAKTLKEVRDIMEGSGLDIPIESRGFLEGTTVEMMTI